MTHVVIDGIEYVPKAEIPPLADDKLTDALKELVSLYYFGDWHMARGRIYNAIEYLAPELAALVDDYPKAAYDRLTPPEDRSMGKGGRMKFHQPTGQFVVPQGKIAYVANSLRFALQRIRASGGRPMEPYDVLELTECDLAQAAIMDVTEALEIDLGHHRFNRVDLRDPES